MLTYVAYIDLVLVMIEHTKRNNSTISYEAHVQKVTTSGNKMSFKLFPL